MTLLITLSVTYRRVFDQQWYTDLSIGYQSSGLEDNHSRARVMNSIPACGVVDAHC